VDVWTKELQFVLDVLVLCDGMQAKVDEYFFFGGGGDMWMNIYSYALNSDFYF
jgi:hypothetical protein